MFFFGFAFSARVEDLGSKVYGEGATCRQNWAVVKELNCSCLIMRKSYYVH